MEPRVMQLCCDETLMVILAKFKSFAPVETFNPHLRHLTWTLAEDLLYCFLSAIHPKIKPITGEISVHGFTRKHLLLHKVYLCGCI
uniref:Uncharacterized protein n=1 Tax=Arundo donax TaxID=35708 RepID=A0A0A9UBY4_ARUDO